MSKPHIFISYAREDKAFVLELEKRLRELKLSPWSDLTSLEPGDRYADELEWALRNASVLLVALSPHSTKSQNVAFEWAFALALRIRVIPVLLQATDVPYPLRALQHVDFTRRGKSWLRLIDSIQSPPIKHVLEEQRVSVKPTIRAEFELEDGVPTMTENEKTYNILLSIQNVPAHARRARFKLHDATFMPATWTEENPDDDFETYFDSYGDVLISATIRGRKADRPVRVETTLFAALRESHRKSRDSSIRKALKAIGDN